METQDLRAVDKTMHDRGALQPGLPSPAAVPENYHMIVIDLKDCSFNIKLQPEDTQRFAFSIPSVNFQKPFQRLSMEGSPPRNSPTLGQKFVSQALRSIRTIPSTPKVRLSQKGLIKIKVQLQRLKSSGHYYSRITGVVRGNTCHPNCCDSISLWTELDLISQLDWLRDPLSAESRCQTAWEILSQGLICAQKSPYYLPIIQMGKLRHGRIKVPYLRQNRAS